MSIRTLSKFNGESGEAKIYSAHTGKLLLATKLDIGPGDIEKFHQLENAIRMAEKEASENTRIAMRAKMYQVLDKEFMP